MLATDIIERFQRKMMSLVATRDGEDEVQPQGAIFGPKAMLINEFAGSGGDAMPWHFQRATHGPLVGQRRRVIEVGVEEQAKNPLPKPKRPAYRDYHKK